MKDIKEHRKSFISIDNNLMLSHLQSNFSEMSKIAAEYKNKSFSKTSLAIKYLKQIYNDINEFSKQLPKLEETNNHVLEVIEILKNLNHDDHFDISLEDSSEKSDDTVEFYKTFSQNYVHELKAKNFLQLNKEKSKFTQKAQVKRKKILDPITEEEEKEKTKPNKGFKRLSDAVKMKEKLNKILQMDYNIFDYDYLKHKLLPVTTCHIFRFLHFFEINILDEDLFYKFSESIASGYTRSITYHNDIHATDVFQTVFCFIHNSDLIEVNFYF